MLLASLVMLIIWKVTLLIIRTCSSLILALLVTRIIFVCGQSEMLFLAQCMRSSSSLGCGDDYQRGKRRYNRGWSVRQAADL